MRANKSLFDKLRLSMANGQFDHIDSKLDKATQELPYVTTNYGLTLLYACRSFRKKLKSYSKFEEVFSAHLFKTYGKEIVDKCFDLSKQSFSCPNCDKKMTSKSGLTLHLKVCT